MLTDEETLLEAIDGGVDLSRLYHARQRMVAADQSTFRALIGGRRSGKTMLIACEAIEVADQFPGEVVSYVAPTVGRARDVIMPHFRRLQRLHGIKLDYNLGEHKVFTPGGGCIQLCGLATEAEVEKGRGGSSPALYVDECFVAGTRVHPIGAVLNVSTRPAPATLVEIDGVICTPDHPFLTPTGWLRAEEIRPGCLLYVWESSPTDEQQSAQDVLGKLSGCLAASEYSAGALAAAVCHQQISREKSSAVAASERARGAAISGVHAPSARGSAAEWASSESSRRERPWAYSASDAVAGGLGFAAGICRCDGYQGQWHPEQLQVGPSVPINQAGNRGGWAESSSSRPSGAGSQERSVARWQRVDRVARHERGGAGEYDRVCPDGCVYNLATASGYYFAGGRLVHNCGAINQRLLRRAVLETYGPTTRDWIGRGGRGIMLSGTPDYIHDSYWHRVCGGNEHKSRYGASVHTMTIFDNPFYAGRAQSTIDEFCRQNGLKSTDAIVQREWYGRFCADADGLAYPHWSGIVHPITLMPRTGYTTMGVDLGEDHPCAWVVIRWVLVETVHEAENRVRYIHHGHVLETYEESGLTVHDVAAITRDLQRIYDVGTTHGDSGGGGAMTIKTLSEVLGIDIQPVQKAGHKQDRIWALDSMLANGTLHVHDRCQTLVEQLASVPRERKGNGLYDHMSGYPDHSLDAAHYAILAARQQPLELDLGPRLGSRERKEAEAKAERDRVFAATTRRSHSVRPRPQHRRA